MLQATSATKAELSENSCFEFCQLNSAETARPVAVLHKMMFNAISKAYVQIKSLEFA